MDTETVAAFAAELEKQALGVGTLMSYLGRRAAQGVGGASALGKSMAKTTAQTSRQAVQELSGLQKHRLKGVTGEGAQLHRKMVAEPARVGLGKTTQKTRGRVGQAIQQEAAGAQTRAGAPLSGAYEGYMTSSSKPYTSGHIEQVMGLKPGQGVVKGRSVGGPMGANKPVTTSGVRPSEVPRPLGQPRMETTQVARPRRRRPAPQVAEG